MTQDDIYKKALVVLDNKNVEMGETEEELYDKLIFSQEYYQPVEFDWKLLSLTDDFVMTYGDKDVISMDKFAEEIDLYNEDIVTAMAFLEVASSDKVQNSDMSEDEFDDRLQDSAISIYDTLSYNGDSVPNYHDIISFCNRQGITMSLKDGDAIFDDVLNYNGFLEFAIGDKTIFAGHPQTLLYNDIELDDSNDRDDLILDYGNSILIK